MYAALWTFQQVLVAAQCHLQCTVNNYGSVEARTGSPTHVVTFYTFLLRRVD